MTLTEIYSKISDELESKTNSQYIDISISATFYEEPEKKYICGILVIEDEVENSMDYDQYAYGYTIENAIENFYYEILQNKITLNCNNNKNKQNKKQITKNLNLRKG